MKSKTELLAPAGDINSFYAACSAGADAIYMGIDKFNARTMAKNFTIEEYIECIKYAHRLGIKVYLTLNTIMSTTEVKIALNVVLKLYENGLDAVILQDIGLATKLHEIFPDLDMHASTQMSVYSLEQVNFLKSLGFKRVVLARELTIKEIKYICDNTDIEIEVFVHGALCVSMSGQCLLSSSIGQRSANKGCCAQPCRMKYTLINTTKNTIIAKDKYLLSKKDIFGIDKILELKEAGVYSFKIEGRNRTYQYVNLAISEYRKALDEIQINNSDKKELSQMFIRESKSLGYLNGVEYKDSITNISPKNTGLILGNVEDQKGPYIKVKLKENIDLHDGFEIYNKDNLNVEYSSIITCIKNNNNKIVNGNEKIDIDNYAWIGDVNKKIPYGSIIYKTSSNYLNKKYSVFELKKPKIDVNVYILKNEKIRAVSIINNHHVETCIDYTPDTAIKSPTTAESIILNFNKTKDEKIEFLNVYVSSDNGLYIPISKLNTLRKAHILNVVNYLDSMNKRNINTLKIQEKIDTIDENITFNNRRISSKNCRTLYIYKYDINAKYDFSSFDRVYINAQDFILYKEKIFNSFNGSNTKLFISIPNFTGKNVSKFINNNLEGLVKRGVAGILLGSFEHFKLSASLRKNYNIKLIADYSFNISNIYSAMFFKEHGFDIIAPSVELDKEEREILSKIIDIEIIEDFVTVMTSRYCVIGSFDQNRNTYVDKCKKPCIKNDYVLKDIYGAYYHIVTDPYDCITRIVKPKKAINVNELSYIRNCIIK